MKIFITDNHNPSVNLALENWLFTRKDLFHEELLFLYRNSESVIIGRFQNPWLECDLQAMTEHHVSFQRRQSGGGAVYHDLGNTNFAFISPKSDFDKGEKTRMIIRALKSLGIGANEGDRSDIYVQNRKISGSASKYSSSRVLHHGTLLIDADLQALNRVLTTKPYKSGSMQSKGIASVRSKVANLIEFVPGLNHKVICDAIVGEFQKDSENTVDIISLKESDLINSKEVQMQLKILSSWDWLYGKTPSFSITKIMLIGEIQENCQFNIVKGVVTKISVLNNGLDRQIGRLIEDRFLNKKCDLLMISL